MGRPSIAAAFAAFAIACGARGGTLDDGTSDAAVCLPAEVRDVVATSFDHGCALEGRDSDANVHRMTCWVTGEPPSTEFVRCVWETNGEQRCTCTDPDWSITCPNGVPICVGWNEPFDFATDVTYEP